ncbi:MAG: lysophospholipid acyltransferase family protein [Mariprofundaceae bacterium]
MKARLVEWLVPQLIRAIYFFLTRSIRWKFVGNCYEPTQSQRFIAAFWHARLLLMPYAFRGCHYRMLISEHRDGGFAADAAYLIGAQTVRGSSTRGGARAMLKMIRMVKEDDCNLGITPDGPKGPREKVQAGTVQIAMKTGLPVLPICYATERHWRAKSWDKFYIPKPFSRGVFVYGDYIFLDRNEDVEVAIEKVQAAMDDTQKQADLYFSKN